MGKFYFAFAWDIIVNLHVCICENKICIWSGPGVNLPICKYTPVCICVRMRHLLTPSKICTPEYIYTCVFLAHANWTLDDYARFASIPLINIRRLCKIYRMLYINVVTNFLISFISHLGLKSVILNLGFAYFLSRGCKIVSGG